MNMTCSEQNRENVSIDKGKWTQSSTYYQLRKAISVFFDGLLLSLSSYFKEGFTSSGELASILLCIFLFAFAFSQHCFYLCLFLLFVLNFFFVFVSVLFYERWKREIMKLGVSVGLFCNKILSYMATKHYSLCFFKFP